MKPIETDRRMKTAFHRIPIYDLRLWVGVCNGFTRPLEEKFAWAFGAADEEGSPGVTLHHRSKFAVLFSRQEISHQLIAHEVRHATDRMMDFVQARFSVNQSEPYAYLQGYITELVYCDLKQWKETVMLKPAQLNWRFKI